MVFKIGHHLNAMEKPICAKNLFAAGIKAWLPFKRNYIIIYISEFHYLHYIDLNIFHLKLL